MAQSSLYQQSPHPSGGTRFFNMKEDWYYQTREGLTVGPFQTRESAEGSLHEYLAVVNGVEAEDMPLSPLRKFFEPPGLMRAR